MALGLRAAPAVALVSIDRYARAMTESPPAERPLSLPRRIVQWYVDHPGQHRCQDVAKSLQADGVEVTTQQVATFSRRKADSGDLRRDTVPVEGWSRPLTLYSAAAAAPVTSKE